MIKYKLKQARGIISARSEKIKIKIFLKKCNLPEKNLYIGMEAQEQEVKTWRMSR